MIVERFSLAPLEPYWGRTRIWWSERSRREQILIGAFLAISILTLLIVAVIAPLHQVREEARADIRNAAILEARLRGAGPDLALAATVRSGTASAILADSAAAASLGIERMEPEGGNTRVVLSDAPFEQVMRWIANIEQTSRLRVREADIERKGAAGIVSASIVVEG